MAIAANTDGAGSESLSQTAGTITTTNTSATAASIIVNTAGGGTGNASIDSTSVGSAAGGTLTINSNGGSILYPGAAALLAGQIGLTNGNSAPARVLAARDFVFTATGAGSIGTNSRPMQSSSFGADVINGSTYSLAGGDGGVFLTKWSGTDMTLTGASAIGAGNIRVVAGNVGGSNMFVTGNVSAQTGSIYLAADDNFEVRGTTVIGGAGFSGTVWMQANRDRGTAGQPFAMAPTASVVTSSTTNNAVPLTLKRTPTDQAVYVDISGDAGNPSTITLGNITTGNGGRIVANATPNAYLSTTPEPEAGIIAMAAEDNVLNAGAAGTVELVGRITTTTVANAIGSAALPIKVAGGTVITNSNYGNTFATGTAAATFTPTQQATETGQTAAASLNLATSAGPLTVSTPIANVNGGAVNLTGADGVVLNAQVGNATTGAININGRLTGSGNIVLGTSGVTIAQNANSTYDGIISGSEGFAKTGSGTLTLSANQTFTGFAAVAGGTLNLGGSLNGANGAATFVGATLANTTGSVTGPVTIQGTLAPGGSGVAVFNTGALDLFGGGTLAANVNATGTAGIDFDQVAVTGTVNVTNAVLRVLVGPTPSLTVGQSFAILTKDGADAITGQFVGGTTISAFDNPRFRFTANYTGGDGNDIVVTLTEILPSRFLDVTGGSTLGYTTGAGIDSSLSIAVNGANYTLTDTAGPINLSAAAIAAGWSGDGTNSVTGPTAGITVLALDLSDGSDSLNGLNGGSANVTVNSTAAVATTGTVTTTGNLTFSNSPTLTLGGTVNPSGNLTIANVLSVSLPGTISSSANVTTTGVVTLDLTGTLSAGASANLTATDITAGASSLIAAPTVSLTTTNAIGSAANRVKTQAGTLAVNAGPGGAFVSEADGATVTATATGEGKIDIVNASGALDLTASTVAGDLVVNSSSGTLTVAGFTFSTGGNISLSSGGDVILAANVATLSGTIAVAANTDGAGAQGYDQKAATISTGNTTPGAVSITVNTASGGTGDAIIGQGTIGSNAGGGLTVASHGGSVLWSNDPVYGSFGASLTGLGNGGSNTLVLKALSYNFVTGTSGSVGTTDRPIQIDNFGVNSAANAIPNLTADVGSGGLYVTGWDATDNHDLTIGPITAHGAGGIRVVTANATGHNLWVSGNVSAESGNIFLAADDNFNVVANTVIGGPGMSGTVWMQANRDSATAGQPFTMASTTSVVTSSTVNVATSGRSPDTQAVYLDISGAVGNPSVITTGNIQVGNGGRIVVNAIPAGITEEAGRIVPASATNVLNAGSTGTVELITGITAAATADAVGTAALPVRVAGGNVVVSTNYGNVFVTGDGATGFAVSNTATASQTAAGPTEDLATTTGVLTINGPVGNARSGPITLTSPGSNGGVVISAPLGGTTTGNMTINAGTNPATLNSTLSLNTDQTLAVTAANGLVVSGAGVLTGAGAATNVTPIAVQNGGLVSPGGSSVGTLNVGNTALATGGTLRMDLNSSSSGDALNVAGTLDVSGAVLDLSVNGDLAVGNAFTILSNDSTDPVIGQFLGGVTINANNDPRYVFTINYAGGDGNDIVATVSEITTTTVLDINAAGRVTLASLVGLTNNVTVTRTATTFTITDTAGVITLSPAAVAAGWTGSGTQTVTGPTAGVSGLQLALNDGADTVNGVDAGNIPLTIIGSGSLNVAGLVSTTGPVTASGMTDITGAGSIQGSTLTLSASNGIGTSSQRLATTGTDLVASAGNGGIFLAEADGANLTATATGTGNIDVVTATGTLNVAALTSTVNGNISLSSADAVTLSA